MTTEPLAKAYDPRTAEAHWYPFWLERGYFHAPTDSSKPPYVIMIPLPNVTGTLHMGHALMVTIQDILIRHHRMKGFNALWMPGTDHAGIATQVVVERELAKEGLKRHEMGRAEFLKRVWAYKEKNGNRILEQLKGLGASLDWPRLRFTMDEVCSRAVLEAFVRLHEVGLIYRGHRLINWCPRCLTALSNEEVEHEDHQGELWSFAYPIDGGGEIVVATTRPETMLGDTAVAVHPEDERYRDVVGRTITHPFTGHTFKVVADGYVDREFGTGAVKITPAHDFIDFEMAARLGLDKINILTDDAHINEHGAQFAGLDRFAARAAVKKAIEEKGLFRGRKDHLLAIGTCQRCSTVVEPYLSWQWFVKSKPLAEAAQQAVKAGRTRILPELWRKTWDHWMDNIQDWCISRQLWWGHQIPAWYCQDCHEVIVARSAPTSCPKCHGTSLRQDEDVLDTWFSSALWPFSTLHWPEQRPDLKAFYPGAVLETGFDILFFWVARMMMMGIHFMKDVPFSDVYLHPMVRDAQGRKMSKSLGNAIDPIDVIEGISRDDLLAKTKTYPVPQHKLPQVLEWLKKEYAEGIPASGADGLRFTLAIHAAQVTDVKLSIPRVAGYRAFLNKIWNAARFALMRIGDDVALPLGDVRGTLSAADRWILSRLDHAIEEADQALLEYRFDDAANAIYRFFWSEFCDWYIELCKPTLLAEGDSPAKAAVRATLVHVLDTSLRLLHPICPYATEEIWQKLPSLPRYQQQGIDSIMIAPYPQSDPTLRDAAAEREIARLVEVVTAIRSLRAEYNVPAGKKIGAYVQTDDGFAREAVLSFGDEIRKLSDLSQFAVKRRGETPREAAITHLDWCEVVVPLAGAIDLDAERTRLHKEIDKTGKELEKLQRKLSNEDFLAKAPPDVIDKDKARQAELGTIKEKLADTLQRLGG